MIASLEGIEKASVRIEPPQPSDGEKPPTVNVSVAVRKSRAGGPLGEDLLQTVRSLVAAVVPGVEADDVKVVEAGDKPAAGTKAKDSKPAAADHAADGHYAWFELDAEAPSSLVTAAYEGRKYVLLSVRPRTKYGRRRRGPAPMADRGCLAWQERQGRQTVQVTLDDAGTGRMATLSKSHRGGLLAVLIDGRVVCLPKIQAKMAAQVEIDGNFDARQAERLSTGYWDRRPGTAKIRILAGGGRRPASSGDGRRLLLTLECGDLSPLFVNFESIKAAIESGNKKG